MYAAVVKLLQSCLTHYDPMDWGPPGSSVHGILQTRILEWVAISFSRGSSQSRDQTGASGVSCIGRQVLYHQCNMGSPYMCVCVCVYVCIYIYIPYIILPFKKKRVMNFQLVISYLKIHSETKLLKSQRICLQFGRPGFDPWVGKIIWRMTQQTTNIHAWRIPMDRGPWQATVHGVTESWT